MQETLVAVHGRYFESTCCTLVNPTSQEPVADVIVPSCSSNVKKYAGIPSQVNKVLAG